ncbi:MAG: extracellular solute-binding protein [Pseudonocardia sp.]
MVFWVRRSTLRTHEGSEMPPRHRRREFTRRDFLAGALATGTLSAIGTYLTPGGSTPSVNIKFVTGSDSSGVRNLLVSMWNQANPRATVIVDEVGGESTRDQRNAMISRAESGSADVLNLDVIHIAYFRERGYIMPVHLEDAQEFIPSTLLPSQLGDPASKEYWAAPFNTDVGMIFERLKPDSPPPGDEVPPLSLIIDQLVADQSRQFAGQLNPSSTGSSEVFVVNMLEHAVSRDPDIINSKTGIPVLALERWQTAFGPLRAATAKGRVTRSDTESLTRGVFRQQSLSYMRNWPAEYRELQQDGDPDSRVQRIRVGPLPNGVLGGGSLAIPSNAPQSGRAGEFIRFLTGEPAQRIIAAYALAPARSGAYEDSGLQTFIPHLKKVRGAVEDALPRPITPGYQEFSDTVSEHFKELLGGKDLTTEFIEDIRRALGLN